eukprot:4497018-Prymnesium_polylepis.1
MLARAARARPSGLLGALRPLARPFAPALRHSVSSPLAHARQRLLSSVAAPEAASLPPPPIAAGADDEPARPRRGPRPEERPVGDTSRKYVKIDKQDRAHATGSRKRATARVLLWEVEDDAAATLTVNGKNLSEWLGGHWAHRVTVMQPFLETDTVGKYSVSAFVRGGGIS